MITIDYQDRRPIYEQIVQRYEMLILRGILAPDTQLPSVRQMAQELSINPNTIQKAYAILESRGYIYPVKGRGNFVSGNAALIERKKETWKNGLSAHLKEGLDLGVTREELSGLIDSLYGGD